MSGERILLVEDDASARDAVRGHLERGGWQVLEADSCRAARAHFLAQDVDAVITDYSLPDGNALELLPSFRSAGSTVPVIVLTGYGTIDLAVRSIQEGADQFLTKPLEFGTLDTLLVRLLERERDRKRVAAGRLGRAAATTPDPFLGDSPRIRQLAEDATRILGSDRPVLILGETGSGKGVLAQWLHRNGPRAEEPYVDLNCAGLTREFLASELFGHERGAFTGAVQAKPGMFEVAHRGTLFLDEIGDADPEVQTRLLTAIEEKRFRRLGEIRDRHVDVRIVAATNHDLQERVRSGHFRSDLYFRIAALPLRVPALRERRGDIPLLARHVLDLVRRDSTRADLELSDAALAALADYAWPGNVRELRNVLERAALLSPGRVIDVGALRFEPDVQAPAGADLALTLEEIERRHIERVLADEHGNVGRAARRLRVARSTLYEMLRRHGLRRGT